MKQLRHFSEAIQCYGAAKATVRMLRYPVRWCDQNSKHEVDRGDATRHFGLNCDPYGTHSWGRGRDPRHYQ